MGNINEVDAMFQRVPYNSRRLRHRYAGMRRPYGEGAKPSLVTSMPVPPRISLGSMSQAHGFVIKSDDECVPAQATEVSALRGECPTYPRGLQARAAVRRMVAGLRVLSPLPFLSESPSC